MSNPSALFQPFTLGSHALPHRGVMAPMTRAQHLGVALLPQMVCAEELEAAQLRVVLPQWSADMCDIQAVFPSRSGMLPAVQALIDFLAAHPPGPVPRNSSATFQSCTAAAAQQRSMDGRHRSEQRVRPRR